MAEVTPSFVDQDRQKLSILSAFDRVLAVPSGNYSPGA